MIFDMLDNRSKQVLHAVVQSYINNPEPVGSCFVTKKYGIGVLAGNYKEHNGRS